MEKFQEGEGEQQQQQQQQQQPYGLFSCWARLKRAFPWRKLRSRPGSERRRMVRAVSRSSRRPKPGDFKYDPLSYAQNFDESSSWVDEEDEYSYRGFSTRFVVITPTAKPPELQPEAAGFGAAG